MAFQRFIKATDTRLDYPVNWANWLLTGDTITASTFTITPKDDSLETDGTILTEDSSSFTTTSALIWLTGGTSTQLYDVTNQITTSGGRIQDQTFEVLIGQK